MAVAAGLLSAATAHMPAQAQAGTAGQTLVQAGGRSPLSPAAASPATLLQTLLETARRNLARGESRLAYEELNAEVARYAGIPQFDYLLGLAALDSGQPAAAILALERVLAMEPGHLQARAEIARAYLANGEREAARQAFEAVATADVPPAVRQVIDRYLAGIAQADASETGRNQFFVEVGTGYDSNVNFGSLSGQWLLADGTAVTPLPVSQPNASALINLAIGGSRLQPIEGGWAAMIGGSLAHRAAPSAHTLDQTQLDLSLGVQKKRDRQTFTMQALFQHLRLDQQAFRNAAGGTLQLQHDIDARNQLGAFVQAFDFRFPDQDVRDARRLTFGITYARAFTGAREPVLVASVYGGRERTRADVPQLDFDLRGVRGALNLKLDDGWRGYLSLSYEMRDHDGSEPLFGVTRADRQTDLRLGADRAIGREWTVSPVLVHTRNASTLAPNDFRRTQALLLARYRF